MHEKKETKEIVTLSSIMSQINQLYERKKEELEELKIEIEQLREIMNELNSIVSNKSFQSADQIYSSLLQGEGTGISQNVEDIEKKYFNEAISKEIVRDTNIKRKIFSCDEKRELLCILNFKDFNRVEIKFIDPEAQGLKETSEAFLNIFVREALIKIKEKNTNMELKYHFYKDTDIIEAISILHLNTISEYDLITSKISQLLLVLSQNH